MPLTYRQSIFADYLLKQLGFNDELMRGEFIEKLEKIYVSRQVKIRWVHKRSNGRQLSYTQDYVEESWGMVITVLIEEVKLKKNKYKIEKNKNVPSDYFSATDLGKFLFCPVSYSLQKTFKTDDVESAKVGTELHDKHLLLQKGGISERTNDYFDNEVIDKIKRSKLVFSGHSKDFSSFKNEEEKFIGIPDYIFLDDNGDYFVVEEKFQFTEDPTYWDQADVDYTNKKVEDLKNKYYPSHKIQILSYIRNIIDYPIKYGYLIYWHYNYRDSKPYIHQIGVNLFYFSSKDEEYYQKTKSDLISFKTNGRMEFSKRINVFKCAKCVVSKYCSHKTGRIEKITLPYSLDLLQWCKFTL